MLRAAVKRFGDDLIITSAVSSRNGQCEGGLAGRERAGGQLSSSIPIVPSSSNSLPAQHLSYFVASFVSNKVPGELKE